MDIRKLQRAIVDGLEDVKAQDIMVFNTEHLSPLFERVIVASGTSNRQTKALAASVRDAVKSKGFAVMRTEGEDNGEWIIVDCGAAVVHVMQPAIRTYYHLEEIWGEKPVKLKLGEAKTRLVKASEPIEAAPAPRPRRSGSAAEAMDKPARKVAAKKAAAPAPAKKAAAKKTAARKTVAAGSPAARPGSGMAAKPGSVPAKKRSVRRAEPVPVVVKVVGKPPAKKAVAERSPVARKVAAKKAAPRRSATAAAPAAAVPARKAPARKTAAGAAPRKPRG
ncbi:ribosome silencing factor [Piscinibacter sp. Jin2]|uniref:Ribosomal silencing factor RsfS n=1 Tax=Aquariibacter lacus TaxID=2801332 RepID=A0A9X0XEE9_9BURK|nr:ribosome silencing factor [Piscinibacter lacus]MBL0719441.1 ribosome silencing factor [Piscinibacter lacus]